MRHCADCNTDNAETSRFCGGCGSVLPDAEVAQSPCLACANVFPEQQKFCGECGTKRGQIPAARPAKPPSIRASAELAVSELKIVTVLFSDMCGFTSLSEQLGVEELRDLMNGWFDRLSRLIPSFGGTIDKFIGDAVMALFGAPVAHENDPKRAIDAALAMQEALADYNRTVEARIGQPLRIRIGINTGRVYAGMLGGDSHQSYTVMGDAVNVASRLESSCPIGSILISESTHEHVRGIYNSRQQEPLTVKGKSAPLTTFEILGRRQATARSASAGSDSGAVALSRQAELAEAKRLLDQVRETGQPLSLAIVSESGMRKNQISSLLGERAKGEPLGASLSTHCDAGLGSAPFQVLVDILTQAAHRAGVQLSSDTSEFANYLGTILSDGADEEQVDETIRVLTYVAGCSAGGLGLPSNLGDPSAMQHATLLSARRWVQALARQGAVLLRVHNIHYASETSLDLLNFLLDTPDLPLFVILTISTSAQSEAMELLKRSQRMDLAPLDTTSAGALASYLLSPMGVPNPALVKALVERSGGNPGFLEESIRALLSEGFLVVGDDGTSWALRDNQVPTPLPIPDTIARMVQVRVDRLGKRAKRILQQAAIAGPRFRSDMLHRVLEDELSLGELERALEESVQAGLLVALSTGDRDCREYRFRPSLVRDEVYDTVVAKQRKTSHLQYAASLQTAATVSMTSFSVGDVAEHLAQGGDHAQASELYQRAGDAARELFANQEARDLYSKARASMLQGKAAPEAQVELCDRLAQVLVLAGEHQEAQQVYEDAIKLLGTTAPLRRAQLEIGRGRSLSASGQRDQARGSYLQAVLLSSEDVGTAADIVLADAQQNLGWLDLVAGNLDDAERLFREAIEHCQHEDGMLVRARCHDMLGGVASARGDSLMAVADMQEALRLRRACGDKPTLATSYLNLGVVHFYVGEYEAARESFGEALTLHDERGNADGIANACLNLGAAELELDCLDAADKHISRATEIARNFDAWYLPECYRYAAEVALRSGRVVEARHLAMAGAEALGLDGLAELRGNLQGALGAVELAANNLDAAASHLAQSATAHEESQNRFELAVTLVRQSELSLRIGAPSQAREYLQRARTLFAEVGNTTWLNRADALWDALP